MADRAKMIALVREHGLDALPVISHDKVEHKAACVARAIRQYAIAAAEAVQKGDLSLSDEAAAHYDLVIQLYGPGLVEALASALLDASEHSGG